MTQPTQPTQPTPVTQPTPLTGPPAAAPSPTETPSPVAAPPPSLGLIHHVELWVEDLARSEAQWGPVLLALGCAPFQHWEHGRSWRLGSAYVVIEQSPALLPGGHQRLRAGLNHLAVHGSRAAVAAALAAGWTLRVDTGETVHLIDDQGFELEIVLT